MQLDLSNLPSDTTLLHRLVRDIAATIEHRDSEIERLQAIIKQLQRAQFGRRSERLDPDQLALTLEDIDSDIGRIKESRPAIVTEPPEAPSRRRALPDHLPREDILLDVDGEACSCCGGALHAIGESVSEMLDWVPAQLRVIRITRPKYGCRACGKVAQVPAPDRPIAGGLATPNLLAHVLVGKYCDHTPLYRQSQIFARHGVDLGRSTLAGWVGGACWWLEALHERLCKNVFASNHLFADDTPIPVLDPGRGRTKTGRLWVYAREQRPWSGPEPPAAVYLFAPDRKAERPVSHLAGFKGVLHVDGYAGFEQLTSNGDVMLAACWAHTRRKFYEVAEATGSPIATEALRRIAELYAIEARVRGQPSAHRLAERRSFSKPVAQALHTCLEAQLTRVPGSSTLAEAIRYALSRWEGLTRFLHDGRVELDTNPVERAIRPVALGRKNHLFAGSDGGGERWAVACSLIETCKLNGVEPYAYLRDVLTRMVDGHPINRLDELLPWTWKQEIHVKT
ncbi:IS66 family transposase [Bradyrhizobium sp. 1]|uniref:IS66 family transposase n=1 Tax=Bradyrhizobium sp. 1 TaxID=241591 RepID=UPI001FFB8AA4|nr:IS66 family transposase [Bradyrhizobium sp. 1]MCK1394339.1 IS66 family transposase [Bradyrhizobium sp. 1]